MNKKLFFLLVIFQIRWMAAMVLPNIFSRSMYPNLIRIKRSPAWFKFRDANLTNSMDDWLNTLPKARQEKGRVVWGSFLKEMDFYLKCEYTVAINNLSCQYDKMITNLKSNHDKDITNLKSNHDKNITNLKSNHDKNITNLKSNHDKNITNLKSNHDTIITNLSCQHDKMITNLKSNITYLQEKLKQAQDFEIRFIPRPLIDAVEEPYMDEYSKFVSNTKNLIKEKETLLSAIPGKIKHITNKLSNADLKPEEKTILETEKSELSRQQDGLPSEIANLKAEIPPEGNLESRAARIKRRKFRWLWILRYKLFDSKKVKKILKYLQQEYNKKDETFKKNCTMDRFIEDFCETMAEVHEDVSVVLAHAMRLIPVAKGYRLSSFKAYGDDKDEYLKILINSIGLTVIRSPTENLFELETMPPDDPHYMP